MPIASASHRDISALCGAVCIDSDDGGVAGGDDELFRSLNSRDWHLPAKIYNFVDNTSSSGFYYPRMRLRALKLDPDHAPGYNNVAIRTVEFDATGHAVLGVGGGITADSDPEAEWDEVEIKIAHFISALTKP